jgi:hypothetical protein
MTQTGFQVPYLSIAHENQGIYPALPGTGITRGNGKNLPLTLSQEHSPPL